ncbi:MAG: tail fiber protein [Bacillota bacterium]
MPNRYANLVGSKKISEDFININTGFDKVQAEMDTNKGTADTHIKNADIHVTKENKAEWDSKADGALQGKVDTHIADTVAHLTKAEHDKLTKLKDGAEPNQNAFSKVNGLEAATTSDGFTIVGDVGIDVTTNPLDKSIHLTVNGESTPGKHGVTHDIGGSDPIPGLAQAVIDATEAKTKASEALSAAKTAQETADDALKKADVDIPDASLTEKGIVQLSNATDGTRENVAATEKSVNDVGIAANTYTDNKLAGALTYTTRNLSFYVDAVNGNDSNDGLSSGAAFKTIAKVTSMIPDIVNHGFTIRLAGAFSEKIDIKNKIGWGTIHFTSTTPSSPASIELASVSNCTVTTEINYLVITTSGVWITSCRFVHLTFVEVTAQSTTSQGVRVYLSSALIWNCTISNRLIGISADRLSSVISSSNNGTGNTVGLAVYQGSVIAKEGVQPSGNTAEQVQTGGVIR